jgi:hypothetical protein
MLAKANFSDHSGVYRGVIVRTLPCARDDHSRNGIIRTDGGNTLLEAYQLSYTQWRNLEDLKNRLNSVGWFVPPYFSSGLLDTVALTIARTNAGFTQADLESVLWSGL